MSSVCTEAHSHQAESQTHHDTGTMPWWGAWSALLIVGAFYLVQALGILMVQVVVGFNAGLSHGLSGVTNLDQTWLLPLSLCLGTIGASMVSWQVATTRAQPRMAVEWFYGFLGGAYDIRSLWRFALLGISFGVGFILLAGYGMLPPDDLPQPLFDAMLAAPFVLKVGWVLMFVILFPVVEEILFRGFLFTGLAQSWGPSMASLLTILAFVAVHMPKVVEYWPALVAVTLIGSFTIWIRIRTNSLAPSIALHSAYNGTLVFAALFSDSFPSSN